jgi:hypothetical protein
MATQVDDYLDIDLELPGGAVVPAGGFYVIGGEFVAESDHQAVFSIGNGTGGDGVRLLDCEGTSVDTVVYGDDNEDGMTDDSDNVAEPSLLPDEDRSLGRSVDGLDADLAGDWAMGVPSPGATNAREEGDLPTQETGCGCGGGAEAGSAPPTNDVGDAPGEGCSTVPGGYLGPFWMVALLAMARRRRLS